MEKQQVGAKCVENTEIMRRREGPQTNHSTNVKTVIHLMAWLSHIVNARGWHNFYRRFQIESDTHRVIASPHMVHSGMV